MEVYSMDLFVLDKLVLKMLLNASGEMLFTVALGGMIVTYLVSGIKKVKK